jgi:hypothetical protein
LSDVIGWPLLGDVFQALVGVGRLALAQAVDQFAPHSELDVCTAPNNVTALCVFTFYVLSRFAHFYVVLTAWPHEVRALFWTVGSVAIYFMAAAVLWTALRP